MAEHIETEKNATEMKPYLNPLSVWALSFGCAVGWGSFVMPGTVFLPAAGPLGTAVGMLVGAVIMFVIGMNYHFLMNRYPSAGGTLTYATEAFGYDHGFLSSWFLILVYVAIMWANATALVLVFRNILPGALQFGFHYQLSGYDIYFGETLISLIAIVLVGLICMNSKRTAVWLQTALALILFGGITFAFIVITGRTGGPAALKPAFAPTGQLPVVQILRIVVLAPWAFVGFESVSHSTEGFKFPVKKTIWIFLAAIITSALAYTFLSLIAASLQPEGCADWADYLSRLGSFDGISGLPTFYATETVLGNAGTGLLIATLLAGVFTGLIGNLTAASRLLYAMAEDDILPEWFGRLDDNGTPRNAITFLTLFSLVIPFFGRTAIGWIVDVNTIGAVIAYGYTSAVAYYCARRENDRTVKITGILGLSVSIVFFLYFMISTSSMATESYLILALWSILGFVFFRYVFRHDTSNRFGKSTVVWIGLLFLIFFTSLMWVRQATNETTRMVLENLNDYNVAELAEHGVELTPDEYQDTGYYLNRLMSRVGKTLTRNSVIQMGLIIASLAIMFSVYTTMSKREKQAHVDRLDAELNQKKAEESSKAKSTFLSNMSHDIRTPMNAIIGYTTLAKRETDIPPVIDDYLTKISSSSQHLLALINDVLEMSRIESGKMDLEPVKMDLKKTLEEVHDMFSTQMETKQIDYFVNTSSVQHPYVICDKNRLNRVLLNLVSNSYKFTPVGGTVSITLYEIDGAPEGFGSYELRVKDSGIGMSKEFAETVFESFTREKTSTVSNIQGTGLGMAITKSIVDLMGGTIDVQTAPGEGTEFTIRLQFPLQSAEDIAAEAAAPQETEKRDFTGTKLLLVDDNAINREIAVMLLEDEGFTVLPAENGRMAVDIVSASKPGDFDAVLMDIQMPEMNGYEATAAIRALPDPELAKIPIIAMTANAFAEDIQAAKAAGMDAHIAKPIDVSKMLTTLSEILH